MKNQLVALGAFLVLALGALPTLAACPCRFHSYQSQYVAPCCAAPLVTPCCQTPACNSCCPAPIIKPCCPAPCVEACPCPAAPIQNPCCDQPETCDDCCD